jgi:anti-repressor protein
MNELKIFENPEFGKVRTMVINGEPYFVGKDVAEMLGYTNTNKALSDHCKGVTKCYIPHPQGNSTLEVNIIPERDVYRLIMRSKLPSAEKFEEWVVSEVLPSIRKTGGYSLNIPKNLPEALRAYAAEIEAHEKTKTALAKKEKKIALDAPKVDFYDSVANSESLLTFEKVAKLIAKKGLGRNKLIGWLRDLKLLRKTDSGNVPYQQYVNKGYFKLVESTRVINGYERVFTTTYVTQKGLDYILKLSKYYEKE